jgi:hypothetical protein
MPTTDSTQPIDRAGDQSRKRRLLQVSADTAIVVLLFSTMFSSRALGAVAGALFVALLLYAWFSLQQPERNAFVLRALTAGLIAGGIAAGVAVFSH